MEWDDANGETTPVGSVVAIACHIDTLAAITERRDKNPITKEVQRFDTMPEKKFRVPVKKRRTWREDKTLKRTKVQDFGMK